MKPALAAASLLACACQVAPGSVAPATPQRPTLSSDTSTTPDGLFEVEAGIARDDAVSLDSPLTLKYGAAEGTELSLGWSPYVERTASPRDDRGPGDVVVGLRHRLGEQGDVSYALLGLVKIPTADDPEIGTGEIDAQLAGISSTSFGDLGATLYYSLGAVGDPAGGTAVSHAGALALSHPIADSTTLFGEVAGVIVPELDGENVFTTLGVAHALEPSTVLDAAVVLGLSDEAADWQALIGITRNLGRIRRPD